MHIPFPFVSQGNCLEILPCDFYGVYHLIDKNGKVKKIGDVKIKFIFLYVSSIFIEIFEKIF